MFKVWFFDNSDEMHTAEFDSAYEIDEWIVSMHSTIEIFDIKDEE